MLAGKFFIVQFASTLIFAGGVGLTKPSSVALGNDEQSTACACAVAARPSSTNAASSRTPARHTVPRRAFNNCGFTAVICKLIASDAFTKGKYPIKDLVT